VPDDHGEHLAAQAREGDGAAQGAADVRERLEVLAAKERVERDHELGLGLVLELRDGAVGLPRWEQVDVEDDDVGGLAAAVLEELV